jgi:hypothetical protein
MVTVRDRQVVSKRWLDVIVARFTPAIEPVDIRDAVCWTTYTAPVRGAWNRSEVIVLWKQLWRFVVQRAPL